MVGNKNGKIDGNMWTTSGRRVSATWGAPGVQSNTPSNHKNKQTRQTNKHIGPTNQTNQPHLSNKQRKDIKPSQPMWTNFAYAQLSVWLLQLPTALPHWSRACDRNLNCTHKRKRASSTKETCSRNKTNWNAQPRSTPQIGGGHKIKHQQTKTEQACNADLAMPGMFQAVLKPDRCEMHLAASCPCHPADLIAPGCLLVG